ncbi:fungal-specific transcription factor domain-containing protein [Aspergillus leporis]|jgi:arginine metabolism regulation protein II|uniref:Fungal-specific transcription factor domain-containing protein n=1 Tax=Aspergillus leporis TaxID=41062 RepID=A0A5N5X555_9EURO|nr:fungal-specific transcription factor domain-containing protein [Aspergillus leporis]
MKLASYNALAMHQSLILFYCCRVHNINAIILQETVKKAMRFIEQACGSNEREEHNASLLWPCFIAAGEALGRTVQDCLLRWLRGMVDRTAVESFAVAADVVQSVWRARQETGNFTLGWFDVLGHYRCPIILV